MAVLVELTIKLETKETTLVTNFINKCEKDGWEVIINDLSEIKLKKTDKNFNITTDLDFSSKAREYFSKLFTANLAGTFLFTNNKLGTSNYPYEIEFTCGLGSGFATMDVN